MKVGLGLCPQNYLDWERYTAAAWDTPPTIPDAHIYDEAIALAQLAELADFDSVWSVEHHFTPYIMVPNPIQLLTFIAGATSRMDVGTMVTVLPWHHPLRLAGEVAVLDILLNGRRLHLGLGRGTAKTEFDAFGVDRSSTRALFAEALEVLRLALTRERFSFSGEFYSIPDVSIRPRPRSTDLADHLLMAWGSPESLPIAANAGLRPLFIPQRTWQEYGQQVREFNAIRASHGWAPVGATAAVWMYCAPSRTEAAEQGEQYVTEYADSVRLHYRMDQPEVFQSVSGYERYTERATALAAAIESGVDPKRASLSTTTSTHVIGTSQQCLDQLRGISEALGIEHLILVLQFGTMPREHAQRSLRLVAEHVAPTLKQLQLGPLC
jgi:alkanesulfonate monooxygenase SsuD/methylene tetrahydromethanopterin reductase-like flavin-dependent oxidoreductase (luciferase family)